MPRLTIQVDVDRVDGITLTIEETAGDGPLVLAQHSTPGFGKTEVYATQALAIVDAALDPDRALGEVGPCELWWSRVWGSPDPTPPAICVHCGHVGDGHAPGCPERPTMTRHAVTLDDDAAVVLANLVDVHPKSLTGPELVAATGLSREVVGQALGVLGAIKVVDRANGRWWAHDDGVKLMSQAKGRAA